MFVPTLRHVREPLPVALPETRLDIVTPPTDDPFSFALSPDGQQIVYVASDDGGSRLWLRRLNTTTAQSLAGTDGARLPFWSPDSRSIAFFAGSSLKRLDLGGGQPQVLATVTNGLGGAWNAEGVILFTPNVSAPVFRVAATGGDAVPVTTLVKQRGHVLPAFLPGGRQFLFFAGGSPETQGVYLGSLDAPDTRRLTAADSAGRYLAPGWLVWIQGRTLRAQRLDRDTQQLVGDPVTLADSVALDLISRAGGFSVSDGGLLAYRGGATPRSQLAWFDRMGTALGVLAPPDETRMLNPRLSPDGRRVAVARTVQGNRDIWLLDGARTSRLTFDAATELIPVWSPDGSRIVFGSIRTGQQHLYIKPSSGAGAEEPLLESTQGSRVATDWSRDGRFLLFFSTDPQSGQDLWVLPMHGAMASPSGSPDDKGDARTPRVFLKTTFIEVWARFSPDGRWVAYQSNESGRHEEYVQPFVEGVGGATGGQWQVSTAGGISPVWRADGQELYYVAPDGTLMAAPMAVRGTELAPGTPVELFRPRMVSGGDAGLGAQYDVSRDGRFLINTVVDDATSAPITLIQHWRPPTAK
jgi:Tol biopolymer transport system component